ncbi:hypothetical protein Q3G72_019067 [Acer saccharum]|nr:hypothetical protein Q3G72_019067 [Acer saccharum]
MASLDDFRILDLSKTLISELPSLSSSLTELKLIGCSELQKLPCTTALKNLELLDVSNSSKLSEIEDKSFQHLKYLRYLNLNTKVENLPSLSNLENLRQLLLKDCSLLKNMPDLEGLTGLEVLDISGCEKLDKLLNLNAFKKLEVLDLSGCSALKVEGNVPFEDMSRLRELILDRFGEFPYEISELTCVKHLVLPHLREVDWGKIKRLPEDVVWGGCGISNPTEIGANDGKPFILVEGTQFFHFLKENPELQEACFKQISFSVHPPSKQANDGENFCYSDEVMFSNVYCQTRHYRKDALALHIRGFNSFPTGLDDILKRTEYISLLIICL